MVNRPTIIKVIFSLNRFPATQVSQYSTAAANLNRTCMILLFSLDPSLMVNKMTKTKRIRDKIAE